MSRSLKKGPFIDEHLYNKVLKLNEQNQKIVFLLFGRVAEEVKVYLNNPNHLILTTSHPSPLGAYKGFFNR